MNEELQITGVTRTPEGFEISYVRLPRDLRKNGLIWQHAVFVPRGSDYDEEIETFEAALHDLLTDVLEDEATAEPVTLTDPDDEDQDDD